MRALPSELLKMDVPRTQKQTPRSVVWTVASIFTTKHERAGDRTRTGDVQLGKLAFYQLNYARNAGLRRRLKYTRVPNPSQATADVSTVSPAVAEDAR